ncbi:MAG: helix-turn-helix domain-containing protein [Lachnospiraceae bacterium]|nr:helix-turn-helix domain-containing protein [Lachnospiraceae bacterium]
MSFSENLRNARKKKGLSQEQLAEALDISRQSVSKWESGAALPETDRLADIAALLGISADYLLTGREATPADVVPAAPGRILIKSFDGAAVVSCMKVSASPILRPAKNEPAFLLQGVDRTGFFGDHNIILAYYADEKSIKKEISEISDAMARGDRAYTLRYYAEVTTKGLSPKLVETEEKHQRFS